MSESYVLVPEKAWPESRNLELKTLSKGPHKRGELEKRMKLGCQLIEASTGQNGQPSLSSLSSTVPCSEEGTPLNLLFLTVVE